MLEGQLAQDAFEPAALVASGEVRDMVEQDLITVSSQDRRRSRNRSRSSACGTIRPWASSCGRSGPTAAHDRTPLVVPVYNEEIRVRSSRSCWSTSSACRPAASSIFVDDGSTDSTVSELEAVISAATPGPSGSARAPIARGERRHGRCGTREASAAYAGFCDLDLSTPLDDLERRYRAASAPRCSRPARATSRPRPSFAARPERAKFLGRVYNRLLQATVVPGIVDTQCGAKVASRSVWAQILPWCREPGYAWDAEAIAIALAAGIPVQEVPISWRHDDRSKVRVLPDGTAMVLATRRIRQAATRARRARVRPRAEVFDDVNAELLMESDRSHWWFRSKAAFVRDGAAPDGGDSARAACWSTSARDPAASPRCSAGTRRGSSSSRATSSSSGRHTACTA